MAFAPGPTRDPGPSPQAAPPRRRKPRAYLPQATAAVFRPTAGLLSWPTPLGRPRPSQACSPRRSSVFLCLSVRLRRPAAMRPPATSAAGFVPLGRTQHRKTRIKQRPTREPSIDRSRSAMRLSVTPNTRSIPPPPASRPKVARRSPVYHLRPLCRAAPSLAVSYRHCLDALAQPVPAKAVP
jgi:hypothetical protein